MYQKKTPIKKRLSIEETSLNAYSTGLLQGKAYRALSHHLTQALFPYKLSIPEWKLLGQLYEKGEMRLAELADLLDVRPPLVTKLVDSLEARGMLLRIRDPEDSRARLISATREGKLVIPKAEHAVKQAMVALLQGVTRDNLLNYLRVLAQIVDNS
jgi:DNA-binding MarR family transcriptional regulator